MKENKIGKGFWGLCWFYFGSLWLLLNIKIWYEVFKWLLQT